MEPPTCPPMIAHAPPIPRHSPIGDHGDPRLPTATPKGCLDLRCPNFGIRDFYFPRCGTCGNQKWDTDLYLDGATTLPSYWLARSHRLPVGAHPFLVAHSKYNAGSGIAIHPSTNHGPSTAHHSTAPVTTAGLSDA